ncbi:MAG TPA: sigma-70 family RNA polymerase sigma factor [Opitutaceae bacterium]
MALTTQDVANRLLAQREAFRGFLRSRLGSEADADDLLQSSLIKALQHGESLRDETRLEAWFYQVLRHAITDHARREQATRHREEAWMQLREDEEVRQRACGCLAGVIASLKPEHARLVSEVELQGFSLAAAASRSGITPGNAGVILHRARREIRRRLELVCGDCSAQSCRDCDCDA